MVSGKVDGHEVAEACLCCGVSTSFRVMAPGKRVCRPSWVWCRRLESNGFTSSLYKIFDQARLLQCLPAPQQEMRVHSPERKAFGRG